jgi:hypothetical protein
MKPAPAFRHSLSSSLAARHLWLRKYYVSGCSVECLTLRRLSSSSPFSARSAARSRSHTGWTVARCGDCSGMSVFASAREGEDEVVLLFCLGFRRMPVATAAAGLDEWSGALPLEPVRRGMPLGATEPTPIASGGFGWLLPPFADLGFEAVGDCEVSSSTV